MVVADGDQVVQPVLASLAPWHHVVQAWWKITARDYAAGLVAILLACSQYTLVSLLGSILLLLSIPTHLHVREDSRYTTRI